jgi:hypothetical protein
MTKVESQYRITQNLLARYVRKNFSDIKIKICGMRFVVNRKEYLNNRKVYTGNMEELTEWLRPKYQEKIWVITKEELSEEKKEELNDLLLQKFNQIELAITCDYKVEIVNLGLTFISPL